MMKVFRALLLGGVVGMLCSATPIPGLVNTGSVDAPGNLESNWDYAFSPTPISNGFVFNPAYVTDNTTYPFPHWVADSPGSGWISPNPGYGTDYGTFTDGIGFYYFRLPFVIGPGFDPDTATFTYQFAVDNFLNSIWLNGQLLQTGGTGTYNSFSGPFTVGPTPGLFTSGLNQLVVIATNIASLPVDPNDFNTWNPAGLRFEVLSSEITFTEGEIPEPGTLLLCAFGLSALGAWRTRRG